MVYDNNAIMINYIINSYNKFSFKFFIWYTIIKVLYTAKILLLLLGSIDDE